MFSQNNVKRVYRMAHNTGWAERQTTVCWTFCKISFGIKYMLWCYLNWPNYSEHCKIHKELGTNSFLLKSSSSWHTGDWHTSSHFRKPSEETISLSIDRQRSTKVVMRCLPTEDALYRRPKYALWIHKILTKQQFPRFSQTTYTDNIFFDDSSYVHIEFGNVDCFHGKMIWNNHYNFMTYGHLGLSELLICWRYKR